ncbi:MAG TPA: aminotransferase class V-fold PLP-dependent enzyme [Isosphaeraceae bacterium]|jgi:hypothetical protein
MPGLLYLDTARIGRMSPLARQAQHDQIRLVGEDAGSPRFDAFLSRGVESWPSRLRRRYPGLALWHGAGELRAALARLTGTPSGCVLLASRTYRLMDLAARLLFRNCQNVLVTDLGWPRYRSLLEDERLRHRGRVTTLPIRSATLYGAMPAAEVVGRISAAYREAGCDGLFLTAVSHEGVRLPVRDIVRAVAVRSRPRFVTVDGAQDLCHGQTDLRGDWCDLYLAGCQKWLGAYHPMGLGFLGRRLSADLIEAELGDLLACGELDDPLLRFTDGLDRGSSDPLGETVGLASLFSSRGAVADVLGAGRPPADVFAVRRDGVRRLAEMARGEGWLPLLPEAALRSGILLLQAKAPETHSASPIALRSAFAGRGIALTAYASGLVRLSMPALPLSGREVDRLRSAFGRCGGGGRVRPTRSTL